MSKTKRGRVAAFTGALAALASISAIAATEMPTGGPPAQYSDFLKMKAEDVMHAMDKTGRGTVSKEEFMQFHTTMFERMDKNRDGRLTAREWLARELQRSDG